jgi:hypothetical protein
MPRATARIPLALLLAALTLPSLTLAEEPKLTLRREDCAALVKHRPAPDVAYQPGVDVYGNPVAPADLPGTPQLNLPPLIAIPIEVDLQDRYHIPANSPLFKGDAQIGIVVTDYEGHVTFNGRPLTDPEADALAAACARGLSQGW